VDPTEICKKGENLMERRALKLFDMQALEKFSAVTHDVSRQLHLFTQKIREAGFPNDVASNTLTISKQVSHLELIEE
jgi:hypothetical protein